MPKVMAALEEEMEKQDRYLGKNPMPQAALVEDGVVFSFQPYQIGTFADGLFHFVLPYESLRKYMR